MKFTIEIHKDLEIIDLEKKLDDLLKKIKEIELQTEYFFTEGEEDPLEVLGNIRSCLYEKKQ